MVVYNFMFVFKPPCDGRRSANGPSRVLTRHDDLLPPPSKLKNLMRTYGWPAKYARSLSELAVVVRDAVKGISFTLRPSCHV